MTAFVQKSPEAQQAPYGAAVTSTFIVNPTVGNLIVVSGVWTGSGTLAISNPGYTIITGAVTNSAGFRPFIGYGYATGGALGITVTGGDISVFHAVEVSGAVASGPLGQQGATAAISSAPTASTAAAVNVGDFVMSAYAIGGGSPGITTTTPPSTFSFGFNANVATGGGAATAYKVAAANAVESAAWPYSTSFSDTNAALIVSFLAASTPTFPSASSKRFTSQRHSFGLSR